jgi:hypothetical protein
MARLSLQQADPPFAKQNQSKGIEPSTRGSKRINELGRWRPRGRNHATLECTSVILISFQTLADFIKNPRHACILYPRETHRIPKQ